MPSHPASWLPRLALAAIGGIGHCEGYPTSRQGAKCTFNFTLTR